MRSVELERLTQRGLALISRRDALEAMREEACSAIRVPGRCSLAAAVRFARLAGVVDAVIDTCLSMHAARGERGTGSPKGRGSL